MLALTFVACGNKGDGPAKAKEDAASGPPVAPLVMPAVGVDHMRRMNFVYGDGRPSYDKAVAAVKAKQPAQARSHAETSVAKDPMHLDAHYLLARILAQAGEHAAAVDHLVMALAGDYYKYGPAYASEAELADFRATPHGQAVTALAAKIADEYKKRVPTALWFVARRSTFKWPKERGTHWATTRGEVYAYDRESKRTLRLTHTDHRVLAFVRAAAGNEIAIVGFDKIDRPKLADGKSDGKSEAKPEAKPDPKPTVAASGAEPPTSLAAVWLQILDTATWQLVGTKISLPAARAIEIGYGQGDQLVVAVTSPTGEATGYTVDKGASKLTKVAAQLPVPRLALTLEEARSVRAVDGIKATWTGDPPTAPTLETALGGKIAVPESGAAAQSSIAVAPGGARIAFATAVDPCAKNVAPSLYVADAKTGTYRHVLTAKSRFAPRWLDASLLAYEDGEGAIRVFDAQASREAFKLDNKPGIALDALSLTSGPRCIHAPEPEPPAAAGSGADDEPPLPPEEPVTKPN